MAENIMHRCLDHAAAPYRRGARFHEDLKAEGFAENRHGLVKFGVVPCRIEQIAAAHVDPVDPAQNIRDDVPNMPRSGEQIGKIRSFAIVMKMQARDAVQRRWVRRRQSRQFVHGYSQFRLLAAGVVAVIADER